MGHGFLALRMREKSPRGRIIEPLRAFCVHGKLFGYIERFAAVDIRVFPPILLHANWSPIGS